MKREYCIIFVKYYVLHVYAVVTLHSIHTNLHCNYRCNVSINEHSFILRKYCKTIKKVRLRCAGIRTIMKIERKVFKNKQWRFDHFCEFLE